MNTGSSMSESGRKGHQEPSKKVKRIQVKAECELHDDTEPLGTTNMNGTHIHKPFSTNLHRVSHIHKTKEKQGKRWERVSLGGASWKRGVVAAVGSVQSQPESFLPASR